MVLASCDTPETPGSDKTCPGPGGGRSAWDWGRAGVGLGWWLPPRKIYRFYLVVSDLSTRQKIKKRDRIWGAVYCMQRIPQGSAPES